jgi:hypothetical protein
LKVGDSLTLAGNFSFHHCGGSDHKIVFWAVCSPEQLDCQRSSDSSSKNEKKITFLVVMSKCRQNINIFSQLYDFYEAPQKPFYLMKKIFSLSSIFSPKETQESIFTSLSP